LRAQHSRKSALRDFKCLRLPRAPSSSNNVGGFGACGALAHRHAPVRAAPTCQQHGEALSRAKRRLGSGARHSPRSLLCGRWMLWRLVCTPFISLRAFQIPPVRVPISTRNDCDLCAIAPIERCTAADPLVEAAAPQPETTGTTAQWRNDVQKPHRQVKSERPRRQRETSQRKKQRSPTMDYAAQPFLGGSRLWF